MCYDTDALLLLLHYFKMISSSTIFTTIKHEYILPKTHENLTPDICKTLLGFALVDMMKKGNFLVIKKSCAEMSLWQYQMRYHRR